MAPYRGANVLHGHLEDLNLDGIVDFADSWGESFDSGSVDSLHVVPVREPLKPSLKVFWMKFGRLKWRIKRRNAEVSATIQLGQADEAPFLLDTREPFFDVKAKYNWSADTETWSGPTGGPHDGFIVVGEDEEAAVTRLLDTATEQKRRVPEN